MADKPAVDTTAVDVPLIPPAATPEVATPPATLAPAPDASVAAPLSSEPAKVDAPALTPTLLEKFDSEKPKEPVKEPTEAAKPAADAKTADKGAEPGKEPAKEAAKPGEPEKLAEPAKPETIEYAYTLPETLKMDDALKGKVHAAFDGFRADPAKGAQALIDLHASTMKEFTEQYAEQSLRNQFDVFNKTKATWEKDWLADPEIGGAGHRTALKAIARARDLGISSAVQGTPQYVADKAQFDQFLAITGAGSHPAFARLLHNLSRYLDEPQAESIPTEIKPPRNNGKAPKGGIYTHPSSANMDK
jgi:hypothetical protein